MGNCFSCQEGTDLSLAHLLPLVIKKLILQTLLGLNLNNASTVLGHFISTRDVNFLLSYLEVDKRSFQYIQVYERFNTSVRFTVWSYQKNEWIEILPRDIRLEWFVDNIIYGDDHRLFYHFVGSFRSYSWLATLYRDVAALNFQKADDIIIRYISGNALLPDELETILTEAKRIEQKEEISLNRLIQVTARQIEFLKKAYEQEIREERREMKERKIKVKKTKHCKHGKKRIGRHKKCKRVEKRDYSPPSSLSLSD